MSDCIVHLSSQSPTMAPSAPPKPTWGVQGKRPGPFNPYDLEQGTKLFLQQLHLASERKTNHENTSESPASGRITPATSTRPTGRDGDTSTPHVGTPQAHPASQECPVSLKEHPNPEERPIPEKHFRPEMRLFSLGRPTPARGASLNVAHEQTYPPTPAYGSVAKQAPQIQARSMMHPLLKKVIRNQSTVTLGLDRQPDGVFSPAHTAWDNDSWAQMEDRTPMTHNTLQEMKRQPKFSNPLRSQSHRSTAASGNPTHHNGGDFPDRSLTGRNQDSHEAISKDDSDSQVDNDAWENGHSNPPSNGVTNKDSFIEEWRSTYCEDWVAGLPQNSPPVACCLEQGIDKHWECDIDPKDGLLQPPVEYPPTRINSQDPGNGHGLDRRMRGTSARHAVMEYLNNQKRLADAAKEMELETGNPRAPSPLAQPSPAVDPKTITRPSVGSVQRPGQANIAATQQLVRPVQHAINDNFEDYRVEISCYLRPAEPADAPQILEIYNWEVLNGRQALDNKPLVLEDIRRLFMECQLAQTPFLVAVQGAPRERARENTAPARPRGLDRQPHLAGPSPKTSNSQPRPEKILGFGFISCPMTGLAGNIHSNVGRFVGKVNVYVENANRRKGIGRAILHRLTLCCSVTYYRVDWYRWHDPVRTKEFDEIDYNSRHYSRLYIETSSAGEDDPDNDWYRKFLDGMDYLFSSTLDKTRKVGYGQAGEWRDTIVWQHDCRDPNDIRECK